MAAVKGDRLHKEHENEISDQGDTKERNNLCQVI